MRRENNMKRSILSLSLTLPQLALSFAVLAVSLLATGVCQGETNLESKYATDAMVQFKAFREANGLPPVKIKFKLSKAAWDYAQVMASKEQSGHSVDGTTAKQRLGTVGYRYSRYHENVASNKGYSNPGVAAFNSWRDSTTGHREAMLSREVTEFGIGAMKGPSGRWYFCLVLAKPQ